MIKIIICNEGIQTLSVSFIFKGLFKDPSECSDIANAAKETVGGLCFVPAFYGLNEPFQDSTAGCGFIG